MRHLLMAVAATVAFGMGSLSAPAPAAAAPADSVISALKNGDLTTSYSQYVVDRYGQAVRVRPGYRAVSPYRYRSASPYRYRSARPYAYRYRYARPYYGPRYGYGYPRGYYYRRDNGSALAAGALGLATGAIIGGVLSQQAAPVNRTVAYCAQRYRSYDPASGTYLGYDGRRHRCP